MTNAQPAKNNETTRKRYPLYWVMWMLVKTLFVPLFRVRRRHRERIPKEGPFILVGNHINLLDPLIASHLTRRHLRFMAKKEIFSWPIIGTVVSAVGGYAINRGEADLSGIRLTLSILKDGGSPLIFPEGTRNPVRNGTLLPLKDGVAMLALKGKCPVVPYYMSGAHNPWRGLVLSVGEPIDLADLDPRRLDKATLAEATRRIRDGIQRAGGIVEEQGAEANGEFLQ